MINKAFSPLVSVVIPTFNRLEELKKAIASVSEQTFLDWEIIIADDGSSDGTKEYFAEYDNPKVSYYFKRNEGLASLTRNYAVTKAKGKYLAFLDSDDLWHSKKLEKQINFLEEQESYRFSFTQAVGFEEGSEILISKEFFKKSGNIYVPLLFRNFIVTSSVVLLRSDFEKLNGFSSNQELTIAEDLKLWLELARLGKGYFHAETLVTYDLGGGVSDDLIKKFQCLDLVLSQSMKLNRVNIFLKWAVEGFYWVRLWLQLRNAKSSAPLVYQEICLKKANPIVKFFFKVGFL